MTAEDYKVTFPYGATSWPYSSSRPHTGEDRKMPLNTPVTVNGAVIGLAGTTGFSTEVHTHTQKVANGAVQHPRGGGFTVPSPVYITETGYRNDIGNYVRYRDAKGVIWSIFHLNKITVSKGLLKENEMVTRKTAGVIVRAYIGETISAGEISKFVGKMTADEFIDEVKTWKRYEANKRKATAGTLIAKNFLMYTIRRVYKNPADAVIKEQQATIKSQQAEIEALKAQTSEDTEGLNKLGEALVWLLKRLGLRNG